MQAARPSSPRSHLQEVGCQDKGDYTSQNVARVHKSVLYTSLLCPPKSFPDASPLTPGPCQSCPPHTCPPGWPGPSPGKLLSVVHPCCPPWGWAVRLRPPLPWGPSAPALERRRLLGAHPLEGRVGCKYNEGAAGLSARVTIVPAHPGPTSCCLLSPHCLAPPLENAASQGPANRTGSWKAPGQNTTSGADT